MSADISAEPLGPMDVIEPDDVRPDLPDRGMGRLLRGIVGVRERLLDWVPEERARYTRLGGVVLGTAVMAAVSMTIGLTQVAHEPWYLLAPVGFLWGCLILAFDSWLIASTHGLHRLVSLWAFVPRLAISVLIGAVVAEPLILAVFASSIHTEVIEYRQQQTTAYVAELRRCNPPTPEPQPPARCNGKILNIPGSPQSISAQLAQAVSSQTSLAATVNKLNSVHQRLVTRASDECAGTKGPGLTGIPGIGNQCKQDRKDARSYATDNQLSAKQKQLTALNSQVTRLASALKTANTGYAGAVNKIINQKQASYVTAQGKIDILDEDAALGRLASRSAFVLAGTWLLRLLLIAVDALPVLVKVMGGKTTYDALSIKQFDMSRKLHAQRLSLEELRQDAYLRVEVHRADSDARIEIDRINANEREHRAKRSAQLMADIDKLAARLLGEDPEPPVHDSSQHEDV